MNDCDNGEIYSEYLDNLTLLDIDKLVAQGYKIVTSNGHIIGIIPQGWSMRRAYIAPDD